MSAWRRRAAELFPERRRLIGQRANLAQFLGALGEDLRAVYAGEHAEPSLEDCVFAFAAWCLEHPGAREIVESAFYAHLPASSAGREAVVRRVPQSLYARLLPLWDQVLEPEMVTALRDAYATRAEISATRGAT